MRSLKLAGTLTAIAAVTHLIIVAGGADWYRFFGAGEQMAQMQEQGSSYPAIITSIIASILAIWSLYAFSGAQSIRTLPLLKPILSIITLIFLTRGLFAIPVVLFADSPYMAELAGNMSFMLISSLICLVIGFSYAIGTYQLLTTAKRQKHKVQGNN
ncbi:hypothetical protein MSG37_17600 [Shewanella sp. 1CM18E]|uniref:hypothetical protein n=1 Tax=Shewanella sp. 1CM18E TaxID=2929169 RepID=UPI0020BF0DB9|nr:hypothetical protein [Shewanella sp. 1CM18E]MCK8046707.1 hypothetical protein [Shewanella sp. 1CM18E]